MIATIPLGRSATVTDQAAAIAFLASDDAGPACRAPLPILGLVRSATGGRLEQQLCWDTALRLLPRLAAELGN
jgi:hypothetical protein